jgi:tetratricopeptide (TPR) repeat protein
MWRIALGSVLGVLWMCLAANAQAPASSPQRVALVVTVANVSSPVYAPRGQDGARVLYAGESLTLHIDIANEGDTPATLVARGPAPGLAIRTHKEGSPVQVAGTLSGPPARVFLGSVQPDQWSPRIALAPGERFRWTATLATETLEPGLYEVSVDYSDLDEHERRVRAATPSQRIEIRAITADAAQEVAYRAALRLYRQGLNIDAEEALRTMIQQYPTSSVAFSLLGNLLKAENRLKEALQAYRTALDILRRGQDERRVELEGSMIPDAIASLELRIFEVQRDLP